MKTRNFAFRFRLIVAIAIVCGSSAVAPTQEVDPGRIDPDTTLDDVDRPPHAAWVDLSAAIEKAGEGIVQIRRTSTGAQPTETVSTGVILGKRRVLAVEAATSDDDQVQIVQRDGRLLAARPVARDPVTMTVVLEVDEDIQGKALQHDPSPPRPGTPLAAVWAREATPLVAAEGIIATEPYWHSAMQIEAFETTAVVQPGAVGGALINGQGQLRGIVVAMQSRTPDAGPAIALPVARLDRILQAAEQRDTQQPVVMLSRGILGVTLQNELGTRVKDVTDNSPAAAAGIEPGDRIVEIDRQPVARSSDLFRRLSHYRGGDEVTVQVQRDGESPALALQLQPVPVHRDGPERREAADLRLTQPAEPLTLRVTPDGGRVVISGQRLGSIERMADPMVPHLRVERTNLEQSIQSLQEEIRQLRRRLDKMQSAHPPE